MPPKIPAARYWAQADFQPEKVFSIFGRKNCISDQKSS